ncbi:hypothetical protein [Caballeronia sp. LZ032]|uniref:gp53-like domain-containing protein n=1 Tax=Caballeronia sp. LZ032 TaxID=3038565 RepID=UPI002866FE9C|nr:hypothetical protein [Caballeronia sp. LZ032]MDR5883615.1 hypothetical protein [Caballeronia sp. LZ032]
MTNLVESDQWEEGVYQYETSDPVQGGPDGVDNKPLKQLANRTKYLFNRIAEILGVAKAYALAGGTANAITAAYTPAVQAIADGSVYRFKAGAGNTGAATFTPNATGDQAIPAAPIWGLDHAALKGGEIVVSGLCEVQWNASLNSGNGAWVLVRNSGGVQTAVAPAQGDSSAKVPTTAWLSTNIQALVASCIDAVASAAGFTLVTGDIGYLKLPSWLGGVILQWGWSSNVVSATTPVTFPIAFTSACWRVIATGYQVAYGVQAYTVLNSKSVTGFGWGAFANNSGSAPVNSTLAAQVQNWWLAIGK